MQPLSREARQEAIDWLVSQATTRRFLGDSRDGPKPRITIDNFIQEQTRYGAQVYRARLLMLSDEELAIEAQVALEADAQLKKLKSELPAIFERMVREDAERALRERQSNLGRRHGPQKSILAAARHYRALGKTASEAWRKIKQHPFEAENHQIVEITKEEMKVRKPGTKGQRSGINFSHWQKRYWPFARQ
jgi:hypothetical protein